MVTILLIVIAILLAIIGLFYQAMSSMGGMFNGFLTGLTERMGPGIIYQSKKDFPVHLVYCCKPVLLKERK